MRKWLSGRASPCQGEGRGFESRLPLHLIFTQELNVSEYFYETLELKWRHSQVVRQRSAKPLFPSSNLGAASKYILQIVNFMI